MESLIHKKHDLIIWFQVDLMEHSSMIYALFLVCLGGVTATSLLYVVCCCCRKRNKTSGGDEESLQGILNDGNSGGKDTTSVKSHNGILGIKAPLLKTKSMMWVQFFIFIFPLPFSLPSFIPSIFFLLFFEVWKLTKQELLWHGWLSLVTSPVHLLLWWFLASSIELMTLLARFRFVVLPLLALSLLKTGKDGNALNNGKIYCVQINTLIFSFASCHPSSQWYGATRFLYVLSNNHDKTKVPLSPFNHRLICIISTATAYAHHINFYFCNTTFINFCFRHTPYVSE